MDATPSVQQALREVTQRLRVAVLAQQGRDPAQPDCAAWGWALWELTDELRSACQLLAGQVTKLGQSTALRDDAGRSPPGRLAEADAHLLNVLASLEQANAAAQAYQAAVGHLVPTTPPESDTAP